MSFSNNNCLGKLLTEGEVGIISNIHSLFSLKLTLLTRGWLIFRDGRFFK